MKAERSFWPETKTAVRRLVRDKMSRVFETLQKKPKVISLESDEGMFEDSDDASDEEQLVEPEPEVGAVEAPQVPDPPSPDQYEV